MSEDEIEKNDEDESNTMNSSSREVAKQQMSSVMPQKPKPKVERRPFGFGGFSSGGGHSSSVGTSLFDDPDGDDEWDDSMFGSAHRRSSRTSVSRRSNESILRQRDHGRLNEASGLVGGLIGKLVDWRRKRERRVLDGVLYQDEAEVIGLGLMLADEIGNKLDHAGIVWQSGVREVLAVQIANTIVQHCYFVSPLTGEMASIIINREDEEFSSDKVPF